MIALLIAVGVAWASVEIEPPPAVGQESIVRVVDDTNEARPGRTVRVVHRPGLAGEREVAIGITDGRGRVRWSPVDVGVAVIRVDDATRAVRISRAEPPLDAITLLGLLALAGSASLAFGVAPRARNPRRRGKTP